MAMKIFYLSGKRGGYGAMRPLLKKLRDSPLTNLQICLTDQHLSSLFGETLSEVSRDFPDFLSIDLGDYGSLPANRSLAMASLFKALTDLLDDIQPDCVLIYGDRAESLVLATVATNLCIKCVHLQGGDITGSIDEHFRHAITKLSHLHLCSCSNSHDRILAMGESPSSIITVGDHHVDEIYAGNITPFSYLIEKLGLPGQSFRYITLLQHSETTSVGSTPTYIRETLEAISVFKKSNPDVCVVAIYPCSDPGYKHIIDALNTSSAIDFIFPNLLAEDFRSLVKNSIFLIGNSSAGIIESPYLSTPSINIGRRQQFRQFTPLTHHVPHNSNDILESMTYLAQPSYLVPSFKPIYGLGRSADLSFDAIISNLPSIPFGKSFND